MKLFPIIAALALSTACLAQSVYKTGSVTSSVASLLTTSVGIKSLQLTDTSAAANLVTIYDNSTASTNRVTAAYTAVLAYSTNVVESFTNMAGVVQSSTNTVWHTENATVAAATNEARIVYRVTVPASGTLLWTPSNAQNTTFGVTIKAAGAADYVLQYVALPY